MHTLKLVLVVLLAAAFSCCLFANDTAPFGGDGFKQYVMGSKHDLSVNTNVSSGTAVCDYCHAPHRGITTHQSGPTGTGAPTIEPPLLWNVTLKSGPFKVYGGSPTFQATVRDPSTASPTNMAAYVSLLCLSCHDGTISDTSFYQLTDATMGTVGTVRTPNIGEQSTLGLSNDHPVDFTYDSRLASNVRGLAMPTDGIGLRIPYVGKTVSLPLFKDQSTDSSGRMECATCHDPHAGRAKSFLRMSNSGSALCLNCH